MKNKWLLVSSVSTGLGIIAGGIYLFFAEHSLLLSNSNWTLSAFWSAFMLWIFVVMFAVALIFNVLAFFELDEQHTLFGFNLPFSRSLSPVLDKQQLFLLEAQQYLAGQGRLMVSDRISGDYLYLKGQQDKLIYIQQQTRQVDISLIRSLFQQMLAADFTAGIVVSYGGFSNQAWIFAQEANIELIDAKSLKRKYKNNRDHDFAII
ncbi:restriction endonuclease [Chromatiaceae bacterium AAb-1]|nr:restriction endonuclease [Chromatiaceae bacterium AAb-1]